MAWIDYKKAFDSVPHTWILRCLELYKINGKLIQFLSNQMTTWKTDMTLAHNNGEITIQDVRINRGIYQGDSLSPLIFCLTLDPLSKIIKDQNIGYNVGKVRGQDANKEIISHLLFMDDIKLFADSDENLQKLIQTLHDYSNDIHMEFGLDKCAKCTIKTGKKMETDGFELQDGSIIEDLQEDASYKYICFEENTNIQHKKMR